MSDPLVEHEPLPEEESLAPNTQNPFIYSDNEGGISVAGQDDLAGEDVHANGPPLMLERCNIPKIYDLII